MNDAQIPETGVPTCYRHPGRETYIRCQRCERPICPDCMRDAAVGFHCVSCVDEGRKRTRQDRTAFGGRRTGNPGLASIVLIGLNVAVWLLVTATGGSRSPWVSRLALAPEGVCRDAGLTSYYPSAGEGICARIGSAVWTPGVADGAPWQLVTSAFAHVEIWHIGFNMLALWILGPQLESVVGRSRFVAVYLLSALSGSAAVMWLTPTDVSTLGASGAVFGLMGGLVVVAVKVRANASPLLTWIGINVVITVVGSQYISWQGHFGGLAGGLIATTVLVLAPRARRTAWQAVGLGLLGLLLVAVIVARMLALS